jgi:drug/metabolite transporter (DMT)-like permease
VAHSYSHLLPGVPLALCSAILFGATPPVSKLLLGVVHPFILAGLLYLGARIGLAVYCSLRAATATEQEARIGRKDIPWLALAIGVGGVVGLLMFGLTLNTAPSSALLLNLEGLATMAIAWVVYRENMDRRLLFGAFAILAGAMLLSWEGQGVVFNLGALPRRLTKSKRRAARNELVTALVDDALSPAPRD